MGVKVESHDQQGGITAGAVNGNNRFVNTIDKKLKTPFWKNPWVITIIGGIAVGIIFLLLKVAW